MGCTASAVRNAEDVFRCGERRRLMKQTMRCRQEFAATHDAYFVALKSMGAAFHNFGAEIITQQQDDQSTKQATVTSTWDFLDPFNPPQEEQEKDQSSGNSVQASSSVPQQQQEGQMKSNAVEEIFLRACDCGKRVSQFLIDAGKAQCGTHAVTLNKLLEWEKKLYEQVKTAEIIRLEYRKRCAFLRSLNAGSREHKQEAIDKARTLVKELHAKIQVPFQIIEAATCAIEKLKDEELHPQLLQLLESLMTMWDELHQNHQTQRKIVCELKPMHHIEASKIAATKELESGLGAWHSSLEKLMQSQRSYVHSLTAWLRMSNMKLEMDTSFDPSSPPGVAAAAAAKPSKQRSSGTWSLEICHHWSLAMDKLPDNVALEAIKSFESVVHKLVELQAEEARERKTLEALKKDLESKTRNLPKLLQQQEQMAAAASALVAAAESSDPGSEQQQQQQQQLTSTSLYLRRPKVSTKLHAINLLKNRVEEEEERVSKAIFDTRAMTMNSLHAGLPSIFQAIAGFSKICLHAYQELHSQAGSNKAPDAVDRNSSIEQKV